MTGWTNPGGRVCRAWLSAGVIGLMVAWSAVAPAASVRVRHRPFLEVVRTGNPTPAASGGLGFRGTIRISASYRRAVATGVLPDSPLTDYLRWRQGLDPPRFNHYHPRLGPLLAARDSTILPTLATIPTTAAQTLVNSPGTSSAAPLVTPQPQTIATPEPATGIMTLVLCGSAAWLRRRTARA